jgi:hypothetical protein
MSEAILGTIIGGLIGLGGTIILLLFEYKKWRKDLRIAHLKEKREKYEKAFDSIYLELGTAFEKHIESSRVEYPIDLLSEISIALPDTVRDAIKSNMPEKIDDVGTIRKALAQIRIQMKLYLSGIDSQIDRELGIKTKVKSA